jgi:phage baseplate assembly protein W
MANRLDRFYTPILPLNRGESFDYDYVRNLEDLVKQNLKNILLTIPGERVMNPEFGVGISNYLFENFGSFEGDLRARISSQVLKYAPFVDLKSVDISSEDDHVLRVTLNYIIPSLSVEDQLSVGTTTDTSTGGPKFLV